MEEERASQMTEKKSVKNGTEGTAPMAEGSVECRERGTGCGM